MALHGFPEIDLSARSSAEHWQGAPDGALVRDCAIPAHLALPHLQGLVRAVEGEIVPRLLLARRAVPLPLPLPATTRSPGVSHTAATADVGDAAQLAHLLLIQDVDVCYAYVEAFFYRGAPIREIYLRLLAPAARCLGLMWEQEECDFMQVTLGLGQLHQLLQRLGALAPTPQRPRMSGPVRRVLLVTVPDEDHSFGVVMVSHFFRQIGWEVCNDFPSSARQLTASVAAGFYSVVGLSAGSDVRTDDLASAVRIVRRSSQNRAVKILVGGALLARHPELVTLVGADATALDGAQAARVAENITVSSGSEK